MIFAWNYIVLQGLGILSLSAFLPSFQSTDCQIMGNVGVCSPPRLQIIFFFFSLYLVALAQGGHKPCVQAFGADQFDGRHPEESKAKSSFFNWWYFGMCSATVVTLAILTYIQDNLSWGLGFGIPCIVMVFALILFLLGTLTYRFRTSGDATNPFVRIFRVFIRAARNWRTTSSQLTVEEETQGLLPYVGSEQFKYAITF